MLTLIAVVLIDGTALGRAALVDEVAAHAPLEERLAALARELAVVLATRLVVAHHALDVSRRRRRRWWCCGRRRRHRRRLVHCTGDDVVHDIN